MTRFPSASHVRLIVATAILATVAATTQRTAAAQSAMPQGKATPSPFFAADDALAINTFAVADLSADGKWIALTQSVRRDSYGNDYRHDGDPAYVHPVPLRLWSVDAKSGQRTRRVPRQARRSRHALVARRNAARDAGLERRRLRARDLESRQRQADDAPHAHGQVRRGNE